MIRHAADFIIVISIGYTLLKLIMWIEQKCHGSYVLSRRFWQDVTGHQPLPRVPEDRIATKLARTAVLCSVAYGILFTLIVCRFAGVLA